MKILFTGSSSFTGYWFIKSLLEAGHEVIATSSGDGSIYEGVRRQRMTLIKRLCRTEFNCPFGSDYFMTLIRVEAGWDLLCHHAADVTNYKSPAFDVINALASNTKNIRQVLIDLQDRGCNRILLTGSVFEQNEGTGSDGLPAVSAYGLSKGLTSEMFRYYVANAGMSLAKFVIPNPFGPYEEQRFTSYLIKAWYEGKTPEVSTPEYVRDNIHVSLLAIAYASFAQRLPADGGYFRCNPSCYVESQGAFARRFAQEIGNRLGIPTPLTFAIQNIFSEPIIRINTDPVAHKFPQWSVERAWDELAEYYCMANRSGWEGGMRESKD
jgi:UDP-glucose 4-epimerase